MMTIPQGWEVKAVDRISKTFAGGTPDRAIEAYYKGYIPWVKSGEVNQTKIYDTEEKITEEAIKNSSAKLIKKNTILVAMYGATAGQIAQLKIDACSNQAVLAVPIVNDCNDYVFYALSYAMPKLLFQAQGSGQPNLSKQLVDKTLLQMPPLSEQEKIAEILSGIDRTIEATQTLIDKEKMIKKGLMVDLLNHGIDEQGRIRTPQTHRYVESPLGMIPEGWEVKRLGEIAKINMGQSPDSDFVNEQRNGIAFLQGNAEFGEIHPAEKYWVTEPKKVADVGEILVSVRAPVGEINRADKAYCIGRGLASVKITKLDHEYGFYAFSMAKEQLNRLAQGSTFLAISKDDLDVISILIPPKDEQQKIAQILSAQDRKIETEEANLAKLQNLKKALMADLLSGKVRVKG